MKSALLLLVAVLAIAGQIAAQSPPPETKPPQSSSSAQPANNGYSGMYAFRKDGEFIQITVEDDGRVTGFISRYESEDSKTFLDQFFKTAKLEGNKLTFSTKVAAGTSFDFKGSIERGEGRAPADEAYYILKGTLTENVTDASKKLTTKSEEVVWKSFPRS